ncbi:hypothetical protein BJX64DRAFT_288505 [Aspergillus heterothallicus]
MEENVYEDLDEHLPFLFVSPRLRHLIVSTTRNNRCTMEKAKRGWNSVAQTIRPPPVAPVEFLTFLDLDYPTYIIPKLTTTLEMGRLKSFDITLDRYINLFMDFTPSLTGFERLVQISHMDDG